MVLWFKRQNDKNSALLAGESLELYCNYLFHRCYFLQFNPSLLQGVCDSYRWVMGVCEALHPALERLDSEHLKRFKLNWVTVNMHIFHSTILTDPDVQDYAHVCCQKVGVSRGISDGTGIIYCLCLLLIHLFLV